VCAKHGDTELLKLVLQHVSDEELEARNRPLALDAWDLDGKPFNLTALHLASGLGNAPTVEALLAHGASPSSRDSHQMTPLHHAAKSGFPDCVSLLLGTPDAPRMSASEVNAFDWMGNTALSYAVSHGKDEEEELRAECVRLLLAACALATADDEMGNTPLMSAATRPAFAAAAHALAPVSDLHALNIQGYNALHICVCVGNLDVFQMLLPLVQDVDARTGPGMDDKAGYNQTALHLACLHGEHAMAAALLELGACRTAVDSNGASPLVFASALGHLACVLHLVGWPGQPAKMEPSSVNAVDQKNGLTPLHHAAHFSRSECCGVLIGAGAKLDVRTRDGLTALDFARRREPANYALHALLAGKWPSQLPGTVCDVCEDTATCFCPTCGWEVYCSGACMERGRAGHQAACKERCSVAERRRRGVSEESS
jgi:ankyrin repeat protein